MELELKSNEQVRAFCLALMRANSEAEVIGLLTRAGYWDEPEVWRFYGDNINNWSTIGNQQSRPDAAFVEKLVNSIDARLMDACLTRGIDPESPSAPQSIHHAVARFYDEDSNPSRILAGQIKEWSSDKRKQVALGITVAATGAKASRPGENPSFTIADCGEGQTPERMPDTLLSLPDPDRSTKAKVAFVQGKFNMGSTGVLKFCGKHNLQLIVSRRNPDILKGRFDHPSDDQWGFTIVRRDQVKGRRPPLVYSYLAPLNANNQPNRGGVLRFSSESLPIFPEGEDAYKRESGWGTLVKLYEYNARGFKSDILRKDGLLSRMDILLPEVALPIRFYECRGYGGHTGSHETTLTGLSVRLDDDKSKKEEDRNIEFSGSGKITVAGEDMPVAIYVFQKGKADTYRRNEGIILTINGQMHGRFPKDFFRRSSVGLSYIADSLLLIVDCTKIDELAVADLFMNSRDRLREGELFAEMERALEILLKNEKALGALVEKRRREATEDRIADSKPLKEVVEALLKRSPTLVELFTKGQHLSVPFKTTEAQAQEKPFVGKTYPTFFRFKGKDYGTVLVKNCASSPCRITFVTDADNDYFKRMADPGTFTLYRVVEDSRHPFGSSAFSLHDGIVTLNVILPMNVEPGDVLDFEAEVTDSTRGEPFINRFRLLIQSQVEPSGKKGGRQEGVEAGAGPKRTVPYGITVPQPIPIGREEWSKQEPPFDEYTALRVHTVNTHVGSSNGKHDAPQVSHDFLVNVDNLHLKREQKYSNQNPQVVETQFEAGLVILGLAFLHDEAIHSNGNKNKAEKEEGENGDGGKSIEDRIEGFTRVVAPVLVPMIKLLSELDEESISAGEAVGEPM
jgi:hypothetical protein